MLKILLADIKMIFRNRQFAFWALMFPILFTFMFGFFFGKNSTSGSVILINNSNTEVAKSLEKTLKDSEIFRIVENIESVDEAKTSVEKGKVAAALVIPENFGAMTPDAPKSVKVINDPANATTNAVISGFLDKFMTGLTYRALNVSGPLFTIDEERVNDRELNYFDFVLAGILGLALMNSSIISVAVGMSKYREDKILKRLTTTPMKTWWFIVGEVLSRLVMNILQVSIILSIGKFIFDAHIYGNVFVIYLLALLGSILFQLLGFVIASFVKTTDAAQGAATAITIPMMFLGGVFFPIDTMPRWLFSIVQYLPIAPLLRSIRSVVLEGVSPFQNPINMAIVFGWIVVCLLIASWRFRLADE
jgi:ABC-2 type transport system permease protein